MFDQDQGNETRTKERKYSHSSNWYSITVMNWHLGFFQPWLSEFYVAYKGNVLLFIQKAKMKHAHLWVEGGQIKNTSENYLNQDPVQCLFYLYLLIIKYHCNLHPQFFVQRRHSQPPSPQNACLLFPGWYKY